MARRDKPTRSIKLPGASSMEPQRPTQRSEVPAGDPGDVLSNLNASAEIRDRSKLPSKVKVITPQVIMNLVRSVTDRFGESVDRSELDQLVLENTQFRMQLESTGEKLEQYKGEYKKVFERFQQSQQVIQQLQQGQSDAVNRHYEEQIAELQQRNANAVDIYTGLQQQLDETLAQYDQLQAEVNTLSQALNAKEEEAAQLAGAGAAAGAANNELQQARAMIVDLRQQLEEVQAQAAESAASAGHQDSQRQELEEQLRGAQAQVVEVKAEVERLRREAKQAGSASLEYDRLREENEAKDVEIVRLKKTIKEKEGSAAKMQNIEVELEQLRAAEGQWLEEKRRMASQLSNETNNRRAVEEKLTAIESGKALTESSKQVIERAAAAQREAEELKDEVQRLKRELDQARTKSSQAESTAADAEKLRKELKAAQDEAKKNAEAAAKAGQTAKELGALSRKYENVETELEGLRAAEGKWLEEKRRMASQLSNETNLRRELEEKLKKELTDEKSGREADQKKNTGTTGGSRKRK